MSRTHHLGRATDELSVADAVSDALDKVPVGLILVARHGRVLFSNHEARRIVHESDAIRITGGRLRAGSAFQDRLLQRLIEATTTGAWPKPSAAAAGAVLTGSSELTRLHVLVSPLNGTGSPAQDSHPVAVFLSDPHRRAAPSPDVLRACFGFTPAEVRVVRELLDGRSVREIAAELSLTENTVRAYLKAMLAKTGCRSQAALVALVLRSVASIEPRGK